MMAAEKYTKADIIDSLYEKTGMSRREIRLFVELFIDEIKDALARNVVIELRGFGTFEIKIRKGRSRARNPRTGEPVEIGSHGIAAFRPGRELKQAVWSISPAADRAGLAAGSTGYAAGSVDHAIDSVGYAADSAGMPDSGRAP
jgi:integration host factor subunit beta